MSFNNMANSFKFGGNRFLSQKPEKYGEPTPKKPKLDISKNVNSMMKAKNVSNIVSNKKNNDDDDDDCVMVIDWGEELDFSEIAQVEHDETLAMSQMTQGNASVAVQINQRNVSKEVKIQQESRFKTTVAPDVRNGTKTPWRRFGSSQYPSNSNVPASYSANAVGKQNGPYNSELERLRLENMRIKEDLNKKTGEAKLLRDKINSSEKQKDQIRTELMSRMNTLAIEAAEKRKSLEKELKSLQTQLEVKKMEIKTAERRSHISSVNKIQPDSPNRPGTSSRFPLQDNGPEQELTKYFMRVKTQGLPLKFLRDSVTPELLKPSQPEASVCESTRSANPRLFSGVLGTEGSGSGVSRSPCPTISHTSLSPCAALLLSPSLVDITSDHAQQVISQVVDLCHKVLLELLKQLESASSSNSRFVERERELLMSGCHQLSLDEDLDLISHRELYRDERGIPARRALALITLLVQTSKFTAMKILSSNPKESTEVLETVRNIVRQVEKQRRTSVYQGVLAASVALITELLTSGAAIPIETQALMVEVLRWVVSARPGSLVLRNVLQMFLAATRFPDIINALCHNSAETTYKENIRHSIIQYTPDSCILQVFCCLLKAAEMPKKHRLTDLLTLWVLSLFCSGRPQPDWLTAVPSTRTCQCHSLVCKLCFSLLSEACFAYPTADLDDQPLMVEVLARGVLLVNTFMNEDQHLLAIVDPQSLGCYEHFLHFVSEAKITLDTNSRDVLEFLCKQEEVLKQGGDSLSGAQNTQLHSSLSLLITGDSAVSSPNVLDGLDSL